LEAELCLLLRLHLQGSRISQARKQHESGWKQSSACFCASIFRVEK
jgi:hypothetical protein